MKKIRKNHSVSSISQFLNHSISRVLFLALIAVTLIPLAFLWLSLSMNSWDVAYKAELSKHKLLASSLVEPIQLKVDSFHDKLKLFDISLQSSSLDNRQQLQANITKFANSLDNTVAISLLLDESKSPIIGLNRSLTDNLDNKPTTTEYIDKAVRYQKYEKKNSISPVFKSSLSNKPVILFTHPILDENSNKRGTLFAEIEPSFIKDMCANIAVGSNGHCIVVDNKNRVLTHPNKVWETTRHNLTSHTLVQKLKKSHSGALEYVSRTDKQETIGAYAKIKNLGWGVLITRPKAELNVPLNSALQNILIWVVAGLLLALILIMLVTRLVTRPLNSLSKKAKEIMRNPQTCTVLKEAPKYSSKELRDLWSSFENMLTLYQNSVHENDSLNASSKMNIRKVMSDMRVNNAKKENNIDPVTGVTSGVFFIEELRKSLLIHRGEIYGLILIEVDNYKPLIEKGNTKLANYIIKHVADTLIISVRDNDMISRYGNAGRFAVLINECNPKSLQGMAKKLRSLVEVNPIILGNNNIYINLSIGVVAHKINEKTTVNSLMSFSERALLKSKSAGENKISTYRNKEIQTV